MVSVCVKGDKSEVLKSRGGDGYLQRQHCCGSGDRWQKWALIIETGRSERKSVGGRALPKRRVLAASMGAHLFRLPGLVGTRSHHFWGPTAVEVQSTYTSICACMNPCPLSFIFFVFAFAQHLHASPNMNSQNMTRWIFVLLKCSLCSEAYSSIT